MKKGKHSDEQKTPAPNFNMAHVYVNQLRKRWYGGKQYGPSMESILANSEMPGGPAEMLAAAETMLAEAKKAAPNASAKTKRRWISILASRLANAGIVPPPSALALVSPPD